MRAHERVVSLPKPHPGQVEIIRGAGRYNVCACGRRFGKSQLGMNRLMLAAIGGPGKPAQHAAWFAPTYKMLLEAWNETRRRLDPVTKRTSEQTHRLDLLTGGTVEMWSLDDPNAARGRAYGLAVIDEAAMVVRLQEAWQEVIRPTLADTRGSAWFLSTPKGLNYFYTLYRNADDGGDWRAWCKPTSDNPYISPVEIASMQHDMPERVFAQEVRAEFLADGAGVFRKIREAAIAEEQDEAIPGHQYIMGADWGKFEDSTVLAVIDTTLNACVHLDRFNQIDYSLQAGRLRALADKFKPAQIIAERNSMGEPIIERLLADNLPVQPFLTTNATKAQIIEALALAFERDTLQIVNHPVLVGELEAYDAERLPSGLLRYGAPGGMHDDCVMALALAWYGVAGGQWWIF